MARQAKKLTALAVKSAISPGRYSDGDGLYLAVDSERRRWIFMYMRDGKRREMGLGSAREVSLADARRYADDARRLLREGFDPIKSREEKKASEASVPLFGEFADELIEVLSAGFKNAKHVYQWQQTLGENYCASIRSKPINMITTEDVLAVLKPHWATKQETASRLRGRIEKVLDAAKARGLRVGENPARWRGHLDHLLSRRQKLQRGHQPALPYNEVPAFIARLRKREGVAASALEFLILTAARAGEVYGATWTEIDLISKLWIVPAGRMKAGKEHRVPLGSRALSILKSMAKLKTSTEPSFLFPGGRAGQPLSNMAFKQLLARMNEVGFVPHGFRSSFRDWCGECTQFPREVAEEALAHLVGNSVERAYRRGDALERRRELMRDWQIFIDQHHQEI